MPANCLKQDGAIFLHSAPTHTTTRSTSGSKQCAGQFDIVDPVIDRCYRSAGAERDDGCDDQTVNLDHIIIGIEADDSIHVCGAVRLGRQLKCVEAPAMPSNA
jgi:hypothetical protein